MIELPTIGIRAARFRLWCAADGGCGGAAWWRSGHGGAARRPRRSCVVAQEPRWRGMAAAWRCCAATEAVAAPCDGHGSSDQREHGGDRRVCAFRLFRVSPAEKKLGVCRRGRRPRPGHAGPAVLIASARDHGHELGRVEGGDDRGGEDRVEQLETAPLLALVRGMCVSRGRADRGVVGALTHKCASWARPWRRMCEPRLYISPLR